MTTIDAPRSGEPTGGEPTGGAEPDTRFLDRELARLTAGGPPPVVFDPPARPPARLAELLDALRVEVRRLSVLVDREHDRRLRAEARVVELEQELTERHRRDAWLGEQIAAIRADVQVAAARAKPSRPVPPPIEFSVAPTTAQAVVLPAPVQDLEAPAQTLEVPVPSEPTPASVMAAIAAAPLTAPAEPSAWLSGVFARLLRSEPVWATHLLIALLPLQAWAHPEPIAYDIGHEGGWEHVTVTPDGCTVQRASGPRPSEEVRFSIDATRDDIGLARVLAAGPRRRRRGIFLPRITGDPSGLAALDALMQVRVSLAEIDEAGIELDPRLALKLVALMRGADAGDENFTLAWEAPDRRQGTAGLVVKGRRLRLGDAYRATTTVVCEPARLLPVLAGVDRAGFKLRGDRAPLDLLRGWVTAAQFSR